MASASPVQQIIPDIVAERFIAALASLVDAGRQALASGSPQASVWQTKVQPLLEAHLAAAKAAAASLTVNHQPLVDAALPLRFLARDTDGYSLEFAGEAAAETLRQNRRLVVLAAWQVCQTARAV